MAPAGHNPAFNHYQFSGRPYQTVGARLVHILERYSRGRQQVTHAIAEAMGMPRLISIDRLSAEQRAKLVAASQAARPSEEYRIQFAALAQRRLELRQAVAGGSGYCRTAALRSLRSQAKQENEQ